MPTASSPYDLPSGGWIASAKQAWARGGDDNISLIAAGVAFYGFLAMVPLMAATVLTYGLIADPQTVAVQMQSLAQDLPGSAAELVQDQLSAVVESSSSKKGLGLILALLVALFSARKGAGALIIALNIAYECKESRSFIGKNLTAIGVTVGGALIALLSVGAIAALGFLDGMLDAAPAVFAPLGKILVYVVLAAAITGGAALLFRYGPACETAAFKWLTPGSLLAAVGIVVATLLFGYYVSNFGNYNATYGSLGAVIVLLTWMWASAYILLLGAEMNAALIASNATAPEL
ncbi:YihY/virulence factor BrkB family protein [uncultured Croceicoccus sp.]|uniref:YihY/virulence factor BrkB family protein n=1 Tax=uncultured Croceicoccus sp. TaxID=1295329 RepID=UPI002638A8D0|nr:YihY/virulence factor BrkB family protein [uncultured Croceicoccus sp.]